jgi:hypothetical protein
VPRLRIRIALRMIKQHTDQAHWIGPLRTRRNRARRDRTAEERDELAPLHVPRKDHTLCKA